MLHVKDHTVETSYMGLKSAARAIWRQDVTLAERLLESCPALAAHLHVDCGVVRLADASAFASCFDAVATVRSAAGRRAV